MDSYEREELTCQAYMLDQIIYTPSKVIEMLHLSTALTRACIACSVGAPAQMIAVKIQADFKVKTRAKAGEGSRKSPEPSRRDVGPHSSEQDSGINPSQKKTYRAHVQAKPSILPCPPSLPIPAFYPSYPAVLSSRFEEACLRRAGNLKIGSMSKSRSEAAHKAEENK